MVSPNALPNPSNTAEIIPGVDALNMTFFTVSHLVAPTDKDASFNSIGMALNTSTHNEMMIGNTITARTKDAEKTDKPVLVTPKSGARTSRVNGTITMKAHNPNTTDGTPASTSRNGLSIRRIFSCEYSVI